jgi:hypothetical protein
MDLERMRRQAKADPSQYRHLLRNVLRELDDLRDGTSNGHHPLGFESGKGDLRDSVTSYIKSDPQKKDDYRLVFREMPPQRPDGPPGRELLAVKPRRGPGDIYEHSLARLSRHVNDQEPGLGVFGDKGQTPVATRRNTRQRLTLAGRSPLRTPANGRWHDRDPSTQRSRRPELSGCAAADRRAVWIAVDKHR